jgi:hypothetical protein
MKPQASVIGAPSLLALPSQETILRLFAGGFVGLMVWEVWARFITNWILGGPLEPAGLVISLVQNWTGYVMPRLAAEAAHYVIGIVGYPVVYFVASRYVKGWAIVLDIAITAIFTVFTLSLAATGKLTLGIAVFWLVVTLVTATRFINANARVANSLSWGSFTWIISLGIMAPLAGLPFLLIEWGGALSFMSYVGHALYGFTAALVFETLMARR